MFGVQTYQVTDIERKERVLMGHSIPVNEKKLSLASIFPTLRFRRNRGNILKAFKDISCIDDATTNYLVEAKIQTTAGSCFKLI